MTTVQQAAISYFGLPEGASLVEGGPIGHFAFIIPLTEEHLRGIADRMKALSEPVPQPERGEMITMAPTQDELRAIWNGLTQKEQGKYGSFGVFQFKVLNDAFCDVADSIPVPGGYREGAQPVVDMLNGRKVQHIDAPVEEEQGLPQAVWVSHRDMLGHQVDLASEVQQLGGVARNYLMQVAMLTEEQRIKYAGGAT